MTVVRAEQPEKAQWPIVTAPSGTVACPCALIGSRTAQTLMARTAACDSASRGQLKNLKIQASLTAHWHDKGADRGLAHTRAHHRSRLSDSVKNGNALRTVHNAALPAR